MTRTLSETLRVGPERVTIRDDDSGATPGFEGGKKAAASALAKLAKPVSDLQERLYAESRVDGRRSILLLLQGMDTSGKGGVVRHCGGLLDPQGVRVTAFKAPTEEERRHDFLWRVEPHSPEAGMIAIFDRSHYEDVLIARVRRLADESEIDRRYGAINDFERRLTDAGTTVVKCFLHISYAKQGERLRTRRDKAAVARLSRFLQDRPRALHHVVRALVRRAERPQVVPQLGDHHAAPRTPGSARPTMAEDQPRHRRTEGETGAVLRAESVRRQPGGSATRGRAPAHPRSSATRSAGSARRGPRAVPTLHRHRPRRRARRRGRHVVRT
jgi:polyphosphate kinase 2 (PPK2 family)